MPRKPPSLHSPYARRKAVAHLKQAGTALSDVIAAVGPCQIELEPDPFAMLVRSILWQQISFAAANTISRRIHALLEPEPLTPTSLLRLSVEDLRSAGVSRPKGGYLLGLAEQVRSGELSFDEFPSLSDQEVHDRLVRLKGVGEWTAHMFLIFSLGRPDVFPHGDLGIRVALQRMFGLAELPDRATCLELAEPWRPYTSVASWYLWKSGD